MSRLGKKIWKISAATVAVVVIVLALGVAVFRIIEPMVPEYRQQAEHWAEEMLDLPVEIDHLDLRWAILGPEIVLQGVRLLDPETRNEIVSTERINVGVSLISALQGQPQKPRYITFVGPKILVRRDVDGKLYLASWDLPKADPEADWRDPLRALSALGEINVRDANVQWVDESGLLPTVNAGNLQLEFESSGDVHNLAGSFVMSKDLQGEIAFELNAIGEPGSPESWQWQNNLETEAVPIGFFQEKFLPREDGSMNGALDASLRMTGSGGDVRHVEGEFELAELAFIISGPGLSAAEGDESAARFLSAYLTFDRDADRWSLGVDELTISDSRGDKNGTEITVRLAGEQSKLLSANLDTPRLHLADIHKLANWFMAPDHEHRELLALSPSGELSDFEASIDMTDPGKVTWSMAGEFSRLSIQAWQQVPGINNLGGTVRATQESGEASIDTTNFQIHFVDLFRGPLIADTLQAEINWESRKKEWQFMLDQLALSNADAQARGQGRINIPRAGGAPRVDIKAWLNDGDGRNKSAYFPVGIMPQGLIDWLDRAIVQAKVPNASLVLRGDLGEFPFIEGGGLFEVRFRAEQGILDYGEGWPLIEQLQADVVFRNAGMFIEGDAGVIESAKIQQAFAGIEDLTDAVLTVNGSADGLASDGLNFLRDSPLRERFGTYLEHARASGDMHLELDLELPIADLSATRISGTADLTDAGLEIRELPRRIENINGTLGFSERAIFSEFLSAEFAGIPVDASIAPDDNSPRTRIGFTGRSNLGDVFAPFKVPMVEHIQGVSDWQADIFVPNQVNEGQFEVILTSNMQGSEISLPAPLAKSAEQSTELLVRVEFIDNDDLALGMILGDLVDSRFRLRRREEAWDLQGGHLVFGEATKPSVEIEGIAITGRLQTFDLDAWTNVGEAGEKSGGGYIPDPINHVDLEIAEFSGFGQHLEAHRFQLSRSEREWLIRVQGEKVAGTVLLPKVSESSSPIVLDMQTMHLAKPGGDAADEPEKASPLDLPAIILTVEDFRFDEMQLGAVNATVEKIANGLQMKEFVAETDSFKIHADGRWVELEGEDHSSVNFKVESTDVGKTLSQFGYTGLVNAKRGNVDAGFTWQGPPFHDVLARADGKLTLEIEKGQIVDVRPGAGKLLGILSIAALPRRLIGDFSDVSGKGLGFDSIRGNFLVFGGNAYTTNMHLKGSVAEVALIGRTGFVDRDYDNVAIVNTDVASTLPVIGAIAAGTGVGAILLVLSQLIKKPLKGLTRTQYHITGSWEDPVIEKMTDEKEGANGAAQTPN